MARAFAPGHITGFFAPYRNEDPVKSGSWGAGFAIDLGATAEVELYGSEIDIEIPYGKGEVTRKAVEISLSESHEKGVRVDIELQLPVGQGFGMSAAGTLATTMALAELLGKERGDALRWAHTAEVLSGTGLSDAIGSYYGGLVVRKEPGLPPYGDVIKKDVIREVWIMVVGEPIDTREFLQKRGNEVTEAGKKAISELLSDISFSNFIRQSRAFAEEIEIGDVLRHIPDGFRGSQVMLGNSVFFTSSGSGMVNLSGKKAEAPLKAIRCKIDNTGARVIG